MRFTAKRAEMDYCRVVGPRGLCRPLDERKGSQQTLRLLHPVRVARKQGMSLFLVIRGVAFWDGPRRSWGPGFCRAGARTPDPPIDPQISGICQPGPDPPDPPQRAGQVQEAPGPWNLPGWGLRPPHGTDQKHINGRGFGILLCCLSARGQRGQ